MEGSLGGGQPGWRAAWVEGSLGGGQPGREAAECWFVVEICGSVHSVLSLLLGTNFYVIISRKIILYSWTC